MDVRDRLKIEFNLTGDNSKCEHYQKLRNRATSVRRLGLIKMFNETINKNPKDSKMFYKAAKS